MPYNHSNHRLESNFMFNRKKKDQQSRREHRKKKIRGRSENVSVMNVREEQ